MRDGYPDYLVRVDHTKMLVLVCDNDIDIDAPPAGVKIVTDEDSGDTFRAFPAAYEVCSNCQGKGSHVNRAIDGNGLSAQDFADDPDFEKAYFSGAYDVPCDVCGGKRVILSPSTEEGGKAVEEAMEGYYQSQAEVEAERRMGA